MKSVLVQKIDDLAALIKYREIANQNFLIQELCNFPNEIGLFYARLPNASNGKITGITLKNFLTVIGDGQSSLTDLLLKNPRHALQIIMADLTLDTIP